jgi:hypothetical protein
VAADGVDRGREKPDFVFAGSRDEFGTRALRRRIIRQAENARAHVLRVLGASVASERRVVMAVLRGYRQALACAQPA